MPKNRTSKLAAMAAVPLLLALLGACGSSDDASGRDGSSAGGNKPAAQSFEDWQLAFSQCMRSKGIDMSDPSGGGIQLGGGDNPDALLAASGECRKELGDPPAAPQSGSDKSDAEVTADHLKIAQCLRKHGYQVSDPGPDGAFTVPDDVPVDVLETCAPNGFTGRATP